MKDPYYKILDTRIRLRETEWLYLSECMGDNDLFSQYPLSSTAFELPESVDIHEAALALRKAGNIPDETGVAKLLEMKGWPWEKAISTCLEVGLFPECDFSGTRHADFEAAYSILRDRLFDQMFYREVKKAMWMRENNVKQLSEVIPTLMRNLDLIYKQAPTAPKRKGHKLNDNANHKRRTRPSQATHR